MVKNPLKMRRHEIQKQQFEQIRHLLPGEKGKVGPTADNFKFLNGVFYYLKTGTPWRDLPVRYGYWKNVHRRYSRWCKKGIFKQIFDTLPQLKEEVYETHPGIDSSACIFKSKKKRLNISGYREVAGQRKYTVYVMKRANLLLLNLQMARPMI